MAEPSDRHPIGWLMAGIVTLLAAVAFVAILVAEPVAGGWLFSLAVVGWVCWWVPNRALRAELEAARYRLSTYNGSETHEALAEVGPVTGPSNVVELFDGARLAEWREQGPDDGLVWCVKSNEGWCAVADGTEPAEGTWCVETLCGYGITLPYGYDRRRPDCAECVSFYLDNEIEEENDVAPGHLGQACGWSEDGTTTCGEPAVTWGFHANGDRVFLCAGHERCADGEDPTQPCNCPRACLRHPAVTLPRSLPGKVSD